MISLSMMLSILPHGIKATEEESPVTATPYDDQSAEHEHDENYGYEEGKPEVACDHKHDETCGDTDQEGNYPDCQHIHDEECIKVNEDEPLNEGTITHGPQLLEAINNATIQKELVIEFNEAETMGTAIKAAEDKISDKSSITTIKVIGDAKSIVGDNDWFDLIGLFYAKNIYSNDLTLDLSEMTKLDTVGNYSGLSDDQYSLDKLKVVKLPDSLKTIGNNAFNKCTKLTTINLPDGLQEIKMRAFHNC